MKKENKEAMHNVKVIQRLLAVSLCASAASCPNGILSGLQKGEGQNGESGFGIRRLQMPSTIKTVMI